MLKIKKAAKICLAVLILAFLMVCGMWFIHYNNNIKPMISNEKLSESQEIEGWTLYTYNSENIAYSVGVPPFLKFTGTLSAVSAINYDENWVPINKYTIGIAYSPRLFGTEEYWFTVYDYTNAKNQNDYPEMYEIYTDPNLNLIRESVSGKYDEYEDDIKDFFAEVCQFYGEDAFK